MADDDRGVGARVRVFWESEGEWFEGIIAAYSAGDRRFLVHYDDGEEQWEDADSTTPIEFLSLPSVLSDQQQQHEAEAQEPPSSPGADYADDDYDDFDDEQPKKSPMPEQNAERDHDDDDLSPVQPAGHSSPPRGAATNSPRWKGRQPPRKPALHVSNAVFFRDEETLRALRKALQQEKSALTHERQTLSSQRIEKEQLAATLKRELHDLKTRVTLASVQSHAPLNTAAQLSTPKTAAEWRERVLDQKLENKQRKQELAEVVLQRQRQCEQLKDRVARVPRRELRTLVDVQVEIAALLAEKRALLEALKRNNPPAATRPPCAAASKNNDGTFDWTRDSDTAKVSLEKELGRLETACSRAQDEIRRWQLSLERENARLLPLQARRIALQQELAKFEASNVLLRSVFVRLDPDALGTISAQSAAAALLTLAPTNHTPPLVSADAVLAALEAQNALLRTEAAGARLSFSDFVACFRSLFKPDTTLE
ncbi:hypothetical protein PybrP1_009225 [[Pythium] brassicae (nom. inval.)]|nr:hypothetical protein PybrP1_009225 [[Pythium] brassicae (nom. inval.)]